MMDRLLKKKVPSLFPCANISCNMKPSKAGVHFPTSLNPGWPWTCFGKNNKAEMTVLLDQIH